MKRALAGAVVVGLVVLGAATSVSGPGCGPTCSLSDRVVEQGLRWTSGSTRHYATSGPEGPFLPFEGETYLHIRHGLGMQPQNIQVMLSFEEHPQVPGAGGYSFAAGNQAAILRQDKDEITIRNSSCAAYWIRVTAEASGDDSDAASPVDASGDAAGDTSVTDAADAD